MNEGKVGVTLLLDELINLGIYQFIKLLLSESVLFVSQGWKVSGRTLSGFLVLSYTLAASHAAAPLPVSFKVLDEMVLNRRHTR